MTTRIDLLRVQIAVLEECAGTLEAYAYEARERVQDAACRLQDLLLAECVNVTDLSERLGVDRGQLVSAIRDGRVCGYGFEPQWYAYETDVIRWRDSIAANDGGAS